MAPAKKDTEATEATETPEGERETAPFYCPGCGRRWNFLTECTGMNRSAPHPPIEVVSTDELREGADPAKHTPAPDSSRV